FGQREMLVVGAIERDPTEAATRPTHTQRGRTAPSPTVDEPDGAVGSQGQRPAGALCHHPFADHLRLRRQAEAPPDRHCDARQCGALQRPGTNLHGIPAVSFFSSLLTWMVSAAPGLLPRLYPVETSFTHSASSALNQEVLLAFRSASRLFSS